MQICSEIRQLKTRDLKVRELNVRELKIWSPKLPFEHWTSNSANSREFGTEL